MFIVFEGIDGSGKTTVSKKVAEALDYTWTKEPTFTSEQADKLNLNSIDDIDRETEFAIDRIEHQKEIKKNLGIGVICDRYIWSGLAYSKLYNPSAYPFAVSLYKHKYFLKPDIYVFVDTPINVCASRKKDQPKEHLVKLREAYALTAPKDVYYVSSERDVDQTVKDIVSYLKLFKAD